jgi:putative endonuclease
MSESYMTVGWTGRVWIDMQVWAMRRLGRRREGAGHLVTGERGEREALFYLRRRGYIVVARRWKSVKLRGDVDLIGWESALLR